MRRLLLLMTCFCGFAQSPPPAPQAQQTIEPIRTSIRVVETLSAETPASITEIHSTGLEQTPGTNLDDRLRDTAGFSLFRRSSSMVANPTTQGVSLRGLGSSGASRTLVLWDGVPVNDPFGGWVYWTQFVPDAIQSVEISRGASTSLFGDRAMSGAIGIFSRSAEPHRLLTKYEVGNENTHDVTLGFANPWPHVALSAAARGFTTDGYYIVPESVRGAVDRRAGVRFATGDLHLDAYNLPGALFLKVDMLAEERANGTALTHNSTGLGTAALHYVRDFAHDSLSALAYGTEEGFHSTFSSVFNSRNTERLIYTQSVPSEAEGGAAFWQHRAGNWNLMGGTDANRVHGADTDHLLPSGLRSGGGAQLQNGIFAQADGRLGPLRLFGGLRESLVRHGSTSDSSLSPSAGASYNHRRLRLRGAVYRAFRAPTLNELYRSFSVGNTFTQANPDLRPETLFGGEAGLDWVGESTAIRITAYRNSISDLITNVTLSSTPTQIVRQRANATAALSRGVEAAVHRRLGPCNADLTYLFVESRYVTGPRVAQVPKHQGTARVAYQHGGTLLSLDVRAFDYQFDDDLNQFRLPGYAALHAAAQRQIAGSLSAVAELENALDRIYFTAFTPTPNIGQPRLWHVGLKWEGRVK